MDSNSVLAGRNRACHRWLMPSHKLGLQVVGALKDYLFCALLDSEYLDKSHACSLCRAAVVSHFLGGIRKDCGQSSKSVI